LYITGCDNELSGNVANGASFPATCKWIDKNGNVFRGTGPGDTDLPARNSIPSQPSSFHNPDPKYSGQIQNVPVQVSGNSNNGPPPKCSCSCTY